MTTAQKIALRLSEVRQRLNEISGLEGDAFTPEIRAESEKLTNEYGDLESRSRAATIAGAEAETRAANDGEGAEIRSLVKRASLAAYLHGAAHGSAGDGAEAELRAALDLGPEFVPLDVLLPPETTASAEHRADAATNVAASDSPRISRASRGASLGSRRAATWALTGPPFRREIRRM